MNAYWTTKAIIQATNSGSPLPELTERERELNILSFHHLLEEQLGQLAKATCPKKLKILERRVQGTKNILIRLQP